MKRQSISFTEPNDEWLKSQIASKEYASKSELVNDLIRQARNQQKQIDFIRLKLERAEKSGFTTAVVNPDFSARSNFNRMKSICFC